MSKHSFFTTIVVFVGASTIGYGASSFFGSFYELSTPVFTKKINETNTIRSSNLAKLDDHDRVVLAGIENAEQIKASVIETVDPEELIAHLASSDPLAAIDILEQVYEHGSHKWLNAYTVAFKYLIAKDIELAISHIRSLHHETLLKHAITNIGYFYQINDPEAGIEWLASLDPTTPSFDSAFSSIMRTYIDIDPQRSAEIVASMDLGHTKMSLIAAIGSKLAEVDPYAALSWTNSFEGQYKELALVQVFEGWSENFPHAALETALHSDSIDDNFREEVIDSVISTFARVDPLGLSNKIERLPIESQELAGGLLVQHWIERDSKSALEWIESSLDDKVKNYAATDASKAFYGQNYPLSIKAASLISDPQHKAIVFEEAFVSWAQHDLQSAKKAIDRIDEYVIDTTLRQRIVEIVERQTQLQFPDNLIFPK